MTEHDAFDLAESEETVAKGGTWRNCTLASWPGLRDAAEGNAKAFVWADEGRFKKTGTFEFNQRHAEFQPLLIDKVSASMMVKLHDALNAANQAKFEDWVGKDRGHFAALWEMTAERVTVTGFPSRG
ncbi:hypothetical protein V3589_11410 [Sinorhizobium fredii]|uniref:hypothetical protein n=1 Tax=Rhizobium fredii TaxID=380 RepID=UPI0030B7B216